MLIHCAIRCSFLSRNKILKLARFKNCKHTLRSQINPCLLIFTLFPHPLTLLGSPPFIKSRDLLNFQLNYKNSWKSSLSIKTHFLSSVFCFVQPIANMFSNKTAMRLECFGFLTTHLKWLQKKPCHCKFGVFLYKKIFKLIFRGSYSSKHLPLNDSDEVNVLVINSTFTCSKTFYHAMH